MKKYVLKSFLFVCLGLITAIVFTSARVPIGPPDAPGIPLAIDVHKDLCTIKYTAPKNNGGAPIIGYFIEWKYESYDSWTRVNEKAINELEYTITGFKEGDRVQFRVFALNAAGKMSLPTDPSDTVTIRDLQ